MEDKLRHTNDLSRTHFGKASADQGWANMRQLLDKEMPVAEKPKRRFVWWWSFAFAGLMAAGAAVFYFWEKDEMPSPETAKPPVAVLGNETGKTAKAPIAPAVEMGGKTVSQNTNETVETSEKKSSPAEPFIKKHTAKTSQTTEHQFFTKKENKLPLPVLPPIKNGGKLLSEAAPLITTSPGTKLETPFPGQADLVKRVDELPLGTLPTGAGPSPLIGVDLPKQRKTGLSAYTAVLASPKNSGGGFGAGFLAERPIKNSRFSIQAGLGYAGISQPLAVVYSLAGYDVTSNGGSQGTAEVTAPLIEDAFVVFNGAWSGITVDKIARTVSENDRLLSHYIEIPLGLAYHRGRWQFFAGANAAVLLASKSDFTSGGIFSDHERGGFFNANNEPALESSSSFTEKIKAFDFAATGGLGFGLSPHIGIDLRYRAGLVDLVSDNNGNKDYNRFFQASLRYRIR